MIQKEIKEYTTKCIELIAKCTVEAFNNNYNLILKTDQILNNLSEEEKEKEKSNVEQKEIADSSIEGISIQMENLCIARKKDGYNCNKKIASPRLFCGNHSILVSTTLLPDLINMVAEEKHYEVIPKTIYVGNNWAEDTKIDKWPQIITTTTSNFFRGYILFFTEYQDYLGAGIFVVQYNAPIKKKCHIVATHYVEVNNYCESLGGSVYVKVHFTPIKKFEEKTPIYNRIVDFLNSYNIPYDLKVLLKGKKDYTDSNPIVTVSKINDILNKHNDVMFFNKDDYLNRLIYQKIFNNIKRRDLSIYKLSLFCRAVYIFIQELSPNEKSRFAGDI